MGILDMLRSFLGPNRSEDIDGTEVAVKYEPENRPDSATGAETDSVTDEPVDADATDSSDGTGDPAAAGTDATASTDSMTQPTDDPETAAEPAEAGAGVTEHSGTEIPAAEAAEAAGPVPGEPDPTSTNIADSATPSSDSEPVERVRGIGPAYAERLAAVDIETVGQLLDADPGTTADRSDFSETRIRTFQENAQDL